MKLKIHGIEFGLERFISDNISDTCYEGGELEQIRHDVDNQEDVLVRLLMHLSKLRLVTPRNLIHIIDAGIPSMVSDSWCDDNGYFPGSIEELNMEFVEE